MLRLAQPRRAVCLQRAILSRAYSAPVEDQGQPGQAPAHPRKPHPRRQKPVNLGANSDYKGPSKLPAKGSLASELLRETETGQVTAGHIAGLAADMAAKRRAARLAREAEQKSVASDASAQVPQRDRTPRTLTPKLDLEQLTRGVQQQPRGMRGDRHGPRGDSTGAQGDRRRFRDGNRLPNGRARKPAPRVLTQNRPPATIEAAEQSLSTAEEAELVLELDLPSQPGPAPVSQNLADIFPKPKPETDLPSVHDKKPNVAKALRTLAGDYSAYVPAPSKDLYTTPIGQLPLSSQVALAVACNKGMHINQRKRFVDVVRKAAGEVRA